MSEKAPGTNGDAKQIARLERELAALRQERDHFAALAEEARNALSGKLEERTRELHELQQQMVEAEREATMAALIAKLSHELRNPLNALSTSLYIIRSKVGEDDRLTKAFDRSDRTIKRCSRILNDLYDFAMTQQLRRQPVNPGRWLEEQTALLRLPDDVHFVLDNALPDMTVEIDREPMTKAVWKVLHNAILGLSELSDSQREKVLKLRTALHDGCVTIEISDNGPGIPDEIVGKVQEPLFSTRGFGVGLGLPIAQQVFEQHGGGLALASTPGEGTTVRLWFPAD